MPKNYKDEPFFIKRAADSGDADSMCRYAELLYRGKVVPKDKKESARYFKNSANQGNVKAMINYANMSSKGDGIPVNQKESAKYYKMAADKGEPNSIFYYAQVLYEGKGVPVDKREAANYFKLAAHNGNVVAMYNYAMMVYRGDGIQPKKDKAARYFKMAADHGQLQSMLNYANMCLKGDEIPVNKSEAAQYFKMAANKGQIPAMLQYANLVSKGDQVPINKDEAVRYLKMAADKGNEEAKVKLVELQNEVAEDAKKAKAKAEAAKLTVKPPKDESSKFSQSSYVIKKNDDDLITPENRKSARSPRHKRKRPPSRQPSMPTAVSGQQSPRRTAQKLTESQNADTKKLPPIENKPKDVVNVPKIEEFQHKEEKLPKIVLSQTDKRTKEPQNQPKVYEKLPKIDEKPEKQNETQETQETQENKDDVDHEANVDVFKTEVQQNVPSTHESKPMNDDDNKKLSDSAVETEKAEFVYDETESGMFKGIIHYLTEKCGGNVHKNGVIVVSSSSVYEYQSPMQILPLIEENEGQDYKPYNCVDLENASSCFESEDVENPWICYDFKDMKVRPFTYSIRSYKNGNNHLQSWCIEASNDKENWTALDERENDQSLNGVGKFNSFKIQYKNDNLYRYIRLRQTGPTTGEGNNLNISALEFFGTLVSPIQSNENQNEEEQKHGQVQDQHQQQQNQQQQQNENENETEPFISKPLKDVPEEPFEIKYKGKEEDRFTGIIDYLTEKCGGNVHKNGAVKITSSSVTPTLSLFLFDSQQNFNPCNCADLKDKENYFESDDIPNSWVCYDFQNLRIKPNMYAIRSYTNGNNHLQTWTVEASNDNENWITLDQRKNDRSINGSGKSNIFVMPKKQSKDEYFRYIRLRQTGSSTINSNSISISAIEFFGSITSNEKINEQKPTENKQKQKQRKKHSSSSSNSYSHSESESNSEPENIEYKTIEILENPLVISYDKSDDGRFQGIIHHLSGKCGGKNVHLEGLVNVTSSSIFPSIRSRQSFLSFLEDDEDYNPYNCVDLDDERSCFESSNEPNSWICYDFQELKVKPNYYSVRTYKNGFNHLQSWVIEGSNDKDEWTVLDKRKNERSLNDTGKSNSFKMNKINHDNDDNEQNDDIENGYFRYLRLRQTGPTTGGGNILNISALEFFGSIVGKISEGPKHHKKKTSSNRSNPFQGGGRSNRNRRGGRSRDRFVSKPVEDVPEEPLDIKYDETKEGKFQGIIHYLSDKCGGNVHKKGAVEVTSSSVIPQSPPMMLLPFLPLIEREEDYNPYNCVDLDNEKSCFESADEPDSWICYDFQNLKVKPESYSIRSYLNGDNHLQNWVIEGSNDKKDWTILDEHKNDQSLNQTGRSKTFVMAKKDENQDEFYRYLRLRQTGQSTIHSNVISISALEFFGSIFCYDKNFKPETKQEQKQQQDQQQENENENHDNDDDDDDDNGSDSSSQKRRKNRPFLSSSDSSDSPLISSSDQETESEDNESDSDPENIEYKKIEAIDSPLDIIYDETDNGQFEGIIHHLSSKIDGKNVHLEGLVKVTSSSIFPTMPHIPFLQFLEDDEDYSPYNCVDFEDESSCFESDDKPNSWICYDFQELKVRPNSYSIRSYSNGNNHLQNWVIEASNDKKNWTVLDERKNDKSLNEKGKTITFKMNKIEENKDEFYRYLRLKQTGKSTIGSHVISISSLEFFGSIVGSISQGPKHQAKKKKNSSRRRRQQQSSSSSSSDSHVSIHDIPGPRKNRPNQSGNNKPFESSPVEGIPDEPFDIKYDETKEGRFKGIIHYLTEKCGGNVHKEGAVEVISSSVIPSLSFLLFSDDEDDYNPYNCADLDDEKSCFESADEPNSWVCYDFQNLKIKPDMYSIRTYVNGDNHLQSWVIEGSNDMMNWVVLDEHIKDKSLNETGKSNTFKITKNEDDEYFRYLRLRQTGRATEGMNILNLSALEFFGSVYCRISVA